MKSIACLCFIVVSVAPLQAQLTLPYSGTDPTAAVSSFQIIKSGTSGRANTLYITGATNSSDVLLANTVGLGRVAYFSINNPSNSQPAFRGETNGTGIGVFGLATGNGKGGFFRILNPASGTAALHAQTNGSGPALFAQAGSGVAADFAGTVSVTASATGIYATTSGNVGVLSSTSRESGTGVVGIATFTGSGGTTNGVRGEARGYAGRGVVGLASGSSGVGVYATNSSSTGLARAMFGLNSSPGGIAVMGWAQSTTGSVYGVAGSSSSAVGYGVFSSGNLGATGLKTFRIDHPFNPENEYLLHYCTEGPEPLNTYSGNVKTDAQGQAWVQLPDYFAEINRDYRYSLTVVDDAESDEFVLAKVASRIKDNRFRIRTSQPHVSVSWRVDGVRNDRWTQRYGAPVEVAKPSYEKGTYQHPELYGKPNSLKLWEPSQSASLKAKASR